MARLLRFALLLSYVFAVGNAFATTYYVAASGSDSNSGTSKTAPWQHAPGMSGCTNTCSSTTPQPGDSIIFRGGDTWHHDIFTWNFAWSGNSSSRIYIGVDKTWYAGSSWTRPIINGDNPLSKTQVSSCTYDQSAVKFVGITGTYVTFDNFEFMGFCWSNASTYTGHYLNTPGGTAPYSIASNNYFHGWTHTACSGCDEAYLVLGTNYTTEGLGDQLVGNVWDGSDSDPHSGILAYGDCYDFHGNTMRYASNGMICSNMHTFHDNLFEHFYNTFDGVTHSNTFEFNNEYTSNNFVYNNIIRNNDNPVNVWMAPHTSYSDWVYNNVVYSITQSDTGGGSAANYWDVEAGIAGYGGGTGTVHFDNNTFQMEGTTSGSAKIRCQGFAGTLTLTNNHFITDAGTGLSAVVSNENNCIINGTNNVYQTLATANGQGYTTANNFAPTSAGDATVGTGTNLSGQCSGDLLALCTDTTLGPLRRVTNLRPSSGAWDVGAYEFGQQAAAPSPPSGLTATVQ